MTQFKPSALYEANYLIYDMISDMVYMIYEMVYDMVYMIYDMI